MEENLSEASETNPARSETSVLGNVHRDIQTDLQNLTHLRVLRSAIQQEQMHFIAHTVRLGVLMEQMVKMILNIHQRRLKKTRIANKTGSGAEVGTKLPKIRHSYLKMYLFKSIQNGQTSFLGVSSPG